MNRLESEEFRQSDKAEIKNFMIKDRLEFLDTEDHCQDQDHCLMIILSWSKLASQKRQIL